LKLSNKDTATDFWGGGHYGAIFWNYVSGFDSASISIHAKEACSVGPYFLFSVDSMRILNKHQRYELKKIAKKVSGE
jgi:hypothetical protein